jgi:RNA polymerase primary sigma factor
MKTKKGGLRAFQVSKSITVRDTKSINSYFKDLNAIDSAPMSKEQENALFLEYRKGCKKSGERILNSNLRFVISVAKAFHKGHPCIEINDLIQSGNIGLLKAMQMYDPDKGFKFISYAVWWIRQKVLEFVKENGDQIRLPGNSRKLQGLQEKFISDFYSKNGYKPSSHEIAQALATKEKNIIFLNDAVFVKSIDENITDKDSPLLKDTIKGDSSEFDQLFSQDISNCINQAFECLNDKEKHVLRSLYSLRGQDKSIGLLRLSHDLGKTREAIRQMRNRALLKVKEYSISNKMEILNYL